MHDFAEIIGIELGIVILLNHTIHKIYLSRNTICKPLALRSDHNPSSLF